MENGFSGLKNILAVILMVVFVSSCQWSGEKGDVEQWKEEIRLAEEAFARKVGSEGMNKGFIEFAADEAVLMRGNQLIEGKEAIKEFMTNQNSKNLQWEPKFIDVAQSGDLGYTYGYYTYTYPDSTGNEVKSTGVFHSVWKRQDDGSWKYVWD